MYLMKMKEKGAVRMSNKLLVKDQVVKKIERRRNKEYMEDYDDQYRKLRLQRRI